MTDPIAFLKKTNEDTMYFHQAMKAPDRDEFVKAEWPYCEQILGTGPETGRSTGYKGTGFRMGYEEQERHTYS
jgi:hypothetical protein